MSDRDARGDRIVLANMTFLARHGVNEREKVEPQVFEVDVELELDLRPAGTSDELDRTIDYRVVYASVREVVEANTFDLIEALAEAISARLLEADQRIDAVVVRVRKPEVDLGGPLDHSAVELRRGR